MAAGRDMRARLVLLLSDGISSGLGRIGQGLERIGGTARRIAAVGTALAALSFAGPAASAAHFETTLRDIEITAGRTGRAIEAAMASSRAELFRMAGDTRVAFADLVEARGTLVGRGIDPAQMGRWLPMIAQVAGASGAAARDLANLNIALSRNARIADDQLAMANAVFMRAGQEGGFELRNAAQYVPGLLAQIALLRVNGMEAAHTLGAGLQVVLEGFGGDTAKAAAGFDQLIGHIMSEHTVKEVKEFDVDLTAVFRNAQAAGVNPFEAMLESIRRIVAVDPARLLKIMPDQNGRQAIAALFDGQRRYAEIRRELAATSPAMFEATLEDRMRGAGAETRQMNNLLTELNTRFGDAANSNLPLLNAGMERLLAGIKALDAHFPGVLDATVSWTAALVLLAGALGVAVPIIGAIGTGLGLLLSPAVLVGAAVAGAAVLIWRNWGSIGPKLARMWGDFSRIMSGLGRLAATAFERGGDAVWNLVTGIGRWFAGLWTRLREGFSSFIAWVDGWSGGAMSAAISGISTAWDTLKATFSALWDGVEARFQKFADWVTDTFAPVQRIIDWASRSSTMENEPEPAQGQVNRRMAARAQRIPGYEAPLPGTAGAASVRLNGNVQIGLGPGLVIQSAETNQPGVAITGSQGPVLGRD